jgi:hypothetical protein
MKIEFEKVAAFKVKGKTRELTFLRVSEWNGLQEWRATTGEALVVSTVGATTGEAFSGAFVAFFDISESGSATVIKASPDLLDELSLLKPSAGSA